MLQHFTRRAVELDQQGAFSMLMRATPSLLRSTARSSIRSTSACSTKMLADLVEHVLQRCRRPLRRTA